MSDETEEGFYILSTKYSEGDYMTWWRPNNAGYTTRLDDAGVYTAEQVKAHPGYYNNGERTEAIPVSEVLKHVVRVVSMDSYSDLRSTRKVNPVSAAEEVSSLTRKERVLSYAESAMGHREAEARAMIASQFGVDHE